MVKQRIKLYQGTESDCSYLPARKALNIYADPHHPDPSAVYNQLIDRGFRRSGEYIYRPGCEHCNSCTPVRVIVDKFRTRRTDRRNLKTNADLTTQFSEARVTDEYFALYRKYLDTRHREGGMDNPQVEDFERFLLNPWGETVFVEVRLNNRCVAVGVTDPTPTGLSAVYTFFDPEMTNRGLGRYCILQQIQLCRQMNFSYLYLGYWVSGSQKMQYKTEFLPQEHYDGQNWIDYNPTTLTSRQSPGN